LKKHIINYLLSISYNKTQIFFKNVISLIYTNVVSLLRK